MREANVTFWYATEGGESHGPITFEVLQEWLNSGRLTSAALVWHADLPSWQPAAEHFRIEPKEPSASKNSENKSASVSQATRSKSRSSWPRISKSCRALLALTGILFLLLVTGYSSTEKWGAETYLTLRIIVLVALPLSGAAAAVAWWRNSSVDNVPFKYTGLLRVGVIIASASIAVATYVGLAQTPLLYRIQIARQAYNHYSTKVDIGTGTLEIEGTIGPGLADEVVKQLRANAAIRSISINSIGGLIDQAMQIAKEIETHKGIETVARGVCNSACILIFMAGERRVADRQVEFGFHATSAVTQLSGVYDLEQVEIQGAEAAGYLTSRGVPQDYIAKAKAEGPERLYPVSAIQMAEAGAVSDILDDGVPVSTSRAKWLNLIDREKNIPADKPVAELLETIAENDPSTVEKYATKLWLGSREYDTAKLGALFRQMISDLADKALPSADDEPLFNVLQVTRDELRYIRDRQRWDVCTGFLNGKGFADVKPPAQLIALDLRAQSALVGSAARNGWRKREVPTWASLNGDELTAPIVKRMAGEGLDVRDLESNGRVSCEWTTNLLAAIADRPLRESAELYRSLLAGAN